MKNRPFLYTFTTLLVLCSLLYSIVSAEVHIGEEKPADWDQRDLLKVTFYQETTDEAITVECGGKLMMVDAGTGPYWQRFWPYLEEHNMTHFDIMYNSHPHYDHLQGEIYLLKLTDIQVDVFYSPFPENHMHRVQKQVVKVLKDKGIPFHELMEDETFTLGNAEITVYFWPEGQDPNARSATLHIAFGNTKILLPSDTTGEAQRYLVNKYGNKLRSDVMKVPHHGLGQMFTDFLPAVQPQFAVYTNYTRSTKACDKQLKKYDIPFMHTSAGTIFLETDGTDWYVEQVPHLLDKKAPIPKKK